MTLVISKAASKGLAGIPAKEAKALMEKLKAYAADPTGAHPSAKAFDATTGRIRHGDWRAIYNVDPVTGDITVTKVAHRKDVYR